MKRVSIIILNYKGADDVIECLESLNKVNYPAFDILVVDNASPDDSIAKIEDFIESNGQGLPKTRVVNSGANGGFAYGNNFGMKKVFAKQADYALILNPDTITTPDFLTKLVEVAENPENYPVFKNKLSKGEKLGFLAPRIFYADKKTVYYNGGVIKDNLLQAYPQDHGKKKEEVEAEKDPFVTDYITGTCVLVSHKAYEKVGPICEDYFMYYEDADWAIQAHNNGFFHAVVPSATVYHKGYTTSGYLSYFYIYYLIRNAYFLARNRGTLSQKLFAYLFSIYKFLKQPIKFLIPAKRKWAKPVMHATWDFWRGKDGKRVTLE